MKFVPIPRTIVFLFLGFILFFSLSCREGGQGQAETPEKAPEEQEVNAPKDIIALEEAQKLYDTYTERRVPIIERYEEAHSEGIDVARFTSFDYATLKEYIAFIEQEAASANVAISSLRVYFGNYPPETESGSGYPRKNTVFLVPTMTQDGQEFGFFIREDAEGKSVAIPIPEASGENTETGSLGETKKHSYATFAPPSSPVFAGDQSLVLNRGNVGPPPKEDF